MHSTWSELPGTGAPSLARVYDVALGGKDNFEVDRQLFRRLSEVYPEYRAYAVANRHFLVHAVQRVAATGTTQFLDLGSGLPNGGDAFLGGLRSEQQLVRVETQRSMSMLA